MTLQLPTVTCARCGYTWLPRVPRPQRCPRCLSYFWQQPRTDTDTKEKPQPS